MIPAGKSSVVVPVIPIDNLARSGNIMVTLTAVANGSDYTLSTKDSGTVTILDDNLAPLSIAGMSLSAKIVTGVAPFATSGTYQLFFAAAGNQYVLMGGPTVNSTMGTFTYVRTAENRYGGFDQRQRNHRRHVDIFLGDGGGVCVCGGFRAGQPDEQGDARGRAQGQLCTGFRRGAGGHS